MVDREYWSSGLFLHTCAKMLAVHKAFILWDFLQKSKLSADAVGQINKGHFSNDNALFGLLKEYGGILYWIDMVSEGVLNMRLLNLAYRKKIFNQSLTMP